MSRCGGCNLYWPEGKDNFGVTCEGDCDPETCASNLQGLVFQLRDALETKNEKEKCNV